MASSSGRVRMSSRTRSVGKGIDRNTKNAYRYAIRRHAEGTAFGVWRPPANRGGS